MSEQKHSPAPWSVGAFRDYGYQITVPSEIGRFPIAIVFGLWDRDGGKPAAEVNARLIAAAPDQHAAGMELDRLSLVIESAVRHADLAHADTVMAALKANRAAIAKATSPAQRNDDR